MNPDNCKYLEKRGDGRPGSTWWYCNHRAAQVKPGRGTCTAADCAALTERPQTSASPEGPDIIRPAVSAAPCPDVVPAPFSVPTISAYRAPEKVLAPYSVPAVPAFRGYAAAQTGTSVPVQPAEEPITMPAKHKVNWDAPASDRFPEAPDGASLRSYCRTLLDEHAGQRGYQATLAQQLGIASTSLAQACKSAPAPSPLPEGASPSQTGVSTPVQPPAAPQPAPLPVPSDDDLLICLNTLGHGPVHASFSTRQWCIQEGLLLPDLSALTEAGEAKLRKLSLTAIMPAAPEPTASERAIKRMLAVTANDPLHRAYDLVCASDQEAIAEFLAQEDLVMEFGYFLRGYDTHARRNQV